MFRENQNGPYGPYEPFLQHGIENVWWKKWIMDEKWKFKEVKKMKIQLWGRKFDFWGDFKDKMIFKKYYNIIRNHSGQISN